MYFIYQTVMTALFAFVMGKFRLSARIVWLSLLVIKADAKRRYLAWQLSRIPK